MACSSPWAEPGAGAASQVTNVYKGPRTFRSNRFRTRIQLKTLFITYDGLLDPLGQSQVLPYLRGIARTPHPLHILSFEKEGNLGEAEEGLRQQLQQDGISWTPLKFTSSLGKPGKAWDLAMMYAKAVALQRRHCF